MEHYFKYMVNWGNGFDIQSTQGSGVYLDTRPKFYKAIIRRLGLDTTQKIDYRDFSALLKPCQPQNMLKAFARQQKVTVN